jgi:uncharacterized membrane protein
VTTLRKVSDALGLGENKGYAIAVFIVLVFAAALVTGYYIATRGPPEGYSTIYLLDSKGTLELPETVFVGRNNTFNVQVAVENHMRKTLNFEVRLKVTEEPNPTFPVDAQPENVYTFSLNDGGKWETPATVTIPTSGNYMVAFELWFNNPDAGVSQFTGNACILNIDALNQT